MSKDETIRPLHAPTPDNWIGCAVCLNIKGSRVPALVVISGISVCEEHISLASKPSFSIWNLSERKKR